jgi:hypothetical protein
MEVGTSSTKTSGAMTEGPQVGVETAPQGSFSGTAAA